MSEIAAARPLNQHLALACVDDAAYVERVYRLLLRRDPEPDVVAELANRLREGTLSRTALQRDLVCSAEFQRLQEIDDAVAEALRQPPKDADDDFVDAVYGLLLRRDADAPSADALLDDLRANRLSRASIVAGIVRSSEFEHVLELDEAITGAIAYGRTGGRLRELTGPPGSDERLIEIPWVLSRYRGEQRVADIGYANAEPAYLAALVSLGAAQLMGVDLAQRDVPGLTGIVADVRELPFDDASLDLVFCVSTLEHVGQDNRLYGFAAPAGEGAFEVALRELRRVLSRDGRILLTVPCGRVEAHGWFAQLESVEWCRTFESAGFAVAEQETYVLGTEGWAAGSAEAVAYGERGPGASGVLCVELRQARRRLLR